MKCGRLNNMKYFDDCDYFEEASEADQVIEEAVDKLTSLISDKTKSEIERYKNWYESANKMRAELQKQVYEQQEQIKVLEIDSKRVKEELDRKDNEIPKVPFTPGEEVWWVGDSLGEEIVCPVCRGKRKVTAQTTEYGELEVQCPHCKGRGNAYYNPLKAYKGYIAKTHISLAVGNKISFSYTLSKEKCYIDRYLENSDCSGYFFNKPEVYKDESAAQLVVAEENEKRRKYAEKILTEG